MLPIFAEWRDQIEAALAAAREELTAAIQAQNEADKAARMAKFALGDVARAFARLGKNEQLSGALDVRRAALETELRAADGPKARARIEVAAARWKIADLEQALDQLNRIAPSEPAAELAQPALEDA